MGRKDLEKILLAYLEDILWHSEDVANTRSSYQTTTELLNQYYKSNDKNKTKNVHFRTLYENILSNIDASRHLKQQLEELKAKSEDFERALKTCQDSKEYYMAKCKVILAEKYFPDEDHASLDVNGAPSHEILDAQARQIEELTISCERTREDVFGLKRASEDIKDENARIRRKYTSLRQKYARSTQKSSKLKRYTNTLSLNASDDDWSRQNATKTDDEEAAKLSEENRELKEAYHALRDENDELTIKNEKLEEQVAVLSEKLKNEEREKKYLRQEIEECEEELVEWERRCKELTETHKDVRPKDDSKPQQDEQLMDEISSIRCLIRSAEHELAKDGTSLKKEMLRVHGRNLQELVATNKKLAKAHRDDDDDSKQQQQAFRIELNRVKGQIKTMEEGNEDDRLGRIAEIGSKFEADLIKVLRDAREKLGEVLAESSRSHRLGGKYEELLSLLREENARLGKEPNRNSIQEEPRGENGLEESVAVEKSNITDISTPPYVAPSV